MNYYKQGDAAKADKIKAAFEKLGYEKVNVIHIGDYANERLFFFTENGKVRSTLKDCGIVHIIKTHPDYKELELPVEPKFKAGDWIVRGKGFVYEPSLITERRDYYICELLNGERATYTLNDVYKNFHLWTIADAKDGDVLVNQNGEMPFVFKSRKGNHIYCHCAYTNHKDIFFEKFLDDGRELHWINLLHEQVQPATKEQRDLLFAKMKEAGYEWDADKKELRKIKPHYDIANFNPFDKVLVRQNDSSTWGISFLGCYSGGMFMCCNNVWYEQCIPFEGNEHLLGTTDPCDEQYINW